MSIIYITEQGSILKKSQKRLLVVKERQMLLDIPVFKVDRILIFGNIQVTTQAMALLLDNGIDVSFLSMNGKFRGKLSSVESKNVFLRLAQYDRWKDTQFKIDMGKSIVSGKLRNQRSLLLRYQRNHPGVDFSSFLKTIDGVMTEIQGKSSLESVMGLEGAATGAYFRAFSKMIKSEFSFAKRERHPSPDPVNALLSLGYVLITNEIASILEGMCFDPFFGFLHGIKYGRKSLALDMVEEFRHPVIDMFTLSLINRNVLSPDDFEKQQDGSMYLSSEAAKRYFELFESRMTKDFLSQEDEIQVCFRELFKVQGGKLEQAVMQKIAYDPFMVR
jgi:CRISPR-associated protein Cas1